MTTMWLFVGNRKRGEVRAGDVTDATFAAKFPVNNVSVLKKESLHLEVNCNQIKKKKKKTFACEEQIG